MDKFVDGSYATLDKAVKAVKALYTQGYAKEDLLLVTRTSQKEALENQTEVRVSTKDSLLQNQQDDDESVLDKVKDTLTTSTESDDEELAELIADYEEDIEQGFTIVLAELSQSVDRDPTTDPDSHYDNHSSINESSDDGSVPQTTDQFKKESDQDIRIDNSDLFHRP